MKYPRSWIMRHLPLPDFDQVVLSLANCHQFFAIASNWWKVCLFWFFTGSALSHIYTFRLVECCSQIEKSNYCSFYSESFWDFSEFSFSSTSTPPWYADDIESEVHALLLVSRVAFYWSEMDGDKWMCCCCPGLLPKHERKVKEKINSL